MNDAYSPNTFEHIPTDNPAPWMGRAGADAPEYDRATSSAFWRGDQWEVVAAAPALGKTQFTSLEYLDRFTEAEQLGVAEATMQNAAVKLWYDRLLAASYIDLEDQRTEAGIDALIAAGLLDSSRKEALMALSTSGLAFSKWSRRPPASSSTTRSCCGNTATQ